MQPLLWPNIAPRFTYDFHKDVLRHGIGILHAGPKTKSLEAAGYQTIGDVVSAGTETLSSLSGIGTTTLRKIRRALHSLGNAHDSSGRIDWDQYCLDLGIPLLPAGRVSKDGNSFVAMAATTIGQLGRTLHNPVLQKIIPERISKGPSANSPSKGSRVIQV